MSNDDTDNDHDYAARQIRNLSEIDENLTSGQALRFLRNYRTHQDNDSRLSRLGNTTNSDHNYITTFPIANAESNNTTTNANSGMMEGDHDIFDEDGSEDGDVASDIISTGIISTTRETDIRSEESANTVTTNSSEQADPSEQLNLTQRANFPEQTTNSLTSSVMQSELVPPQETNDNLNIEPASSETHHMSNNIYRNDVEVISLDSPSPPKKRKRLSLEAREKSTTPKIKSKNNNDLDDEDDGLTCPICLDYWEMSGEHRLASLKCGHLFGDSCIRRWLQESSRQTGQRVCPQCKTKANSKDIRYLYAKRLRVLDRSEEHRMREQLTEERAKTQNLALELATVKMSYAQVSQKLKTLEADNDSLRILLSNGGNYSYSKSVNQKSSVIYKLFMDRNIEISREPGCRVMTYAEKQTSLIVSQRSCHGLFPGYGLRFVDTVSFKPTNFLHISLKLLRDISLSDDQQLLAAASMETKVKLFDLRTLAVSATFKPAEKPLWSCALGRKECEQYLYLGSQHGSVYVYDLRFPETFVDEHQPEGDLSPVIQVAPIPVNQLFPFGGFLVCKLTSLWLYEHDGVVTHATRLPIEGRFISMDFEAVQFTLLVQTRSCVRHRRARYIIGKLNKINDIPVFEIKVTFFASTNSPVMARCSQIAVESNTLVAAYIQDSKLLSLYDINREQCIQSLPAQDVIYDTCPIYSKDFTYLAALTETKCRLYKLNTT